jgi:hypothetical protein
MRKSAIIALPSIALVSLVAGLILLYKAGCIADLKSGLGDPVHALHLEYLAGTCLLSSWIASLLVVVLLKPRTFWFIGLAAMLGPMLWVAGLYFEGLAITECFYGASGVT